MWMMWCSRRGNWKLINNPYWNWPFRLSKFDSEKKKRMEQAFCLNALVNFGLDRRMCTVHVRCCIVDCARECCGHKSESKCAYDFLSPPSPPPMASLYVCMGAYAAKSDAKEYNVYCTHSPDVLRIFFFPFQFVMLPFVVVISVLFMAFYSMKYSFFRQSKLLLLLLVAMHLFHIHISTAPAPATTLFFRYCLWSDIFIFESSEWNASANCFVAECDPGQNDCYHMDDSENQRTCLDQSEIIWILYFSSFPMVNIFNRSRNGLVAKLKVRFQPIRFFSSFCVAEKKKKSTCPIEMRACAHAVQRKINSFHGRIEFSADSR